MAARSIGSRGRRRWADRHGCTGCDDTVRIQRIHAPRPIPPGAASSSDDASGSGLGARRGRCGSQLGRQRAVGRRQVHLLDVLLEHPRGREPPDRRWPSTCASCPASGEAAPAASRSYQRGTISVSSSWYSAWASAQSWAPSSGSVSRPPMAQPLSPVQPSSHQPSSTEQLTTPFMAAFMPLVPDASSGRRGLLSQTSTPWTR